MTACRVGVACAVALLFAGCSLLPERTVYVEMAPECAVPPQPSLPEIPAEALDPLPDSVYWDVVTRDARLQDWSLEMRAVLREICNEDGA